MDITFLVFSTYMPTSELKNVIVFYALEKKFENKIGNEIVRVIEVKPGILC